MKIKLKKHYYHDEEQQLSFLKESTFQNIQTEQKEG